MNLLPVIIINYYCKTKDMLYPEFSIIDIN